MAVAEGSLERIKGALANNAGASAAGLARGAEHAEGVGHTGA